MAPTKIKPGTILQGSPVLPSTRAETPNCRSSETQTRNLTGKRRGTEAFPAGTAALLRRARHRLQYPESNARLGARTTSPRRHRSAWCRREVSGDTSPITGPASLRSPRHLPDYDHGPPEESLPAPCLRPFCRGDAACACAGVAIDGTSREHRARRLDYGLRSSPFQYFHPGKFNPESQIYIDLCINNFTGNMLSFGYKY